MMSAVVETRGGIETARQPALADADGFDAAPGSAPWDSAVVAGGFGGGVGGGVPDKGVEPAGAAFEVEPFEAEGSFGEAAEDGGGFVPVAEGGGVVVGRGVRDAGSGGGVGGGGGGGGG